jgi:hypothetical protein
MSFIAEQGFAVAPSEYQRSAKSSRSSADNENIELHGNKPFVA